MKIKGVLRTLMIAIATLSRLTRANDEQDGCSSTLRLKKNETVHINFGRNLTSDRGWVPTTCVTKMFADQGWRIVLRFDYEPADILTGTDDNCDGSSSSLMIGNDYTNVGNETVTSYTYCREVHGEEMISRDWRLWLVVNDAANRPSQLNVTVSSRQEVSCMSEEMRCSPVQCVHRSLICNGRTDCANGLDEYCYDLSKVSAPNTASSDAQRHPSATGPPDMVRRLPPEDSPCFLCRDGTCVLPRVARYDWRWGTWPWYLCDGVPHCPDGWDEHGYMCLYFKLYPQRYEQDLFQCQAFDLPASVSRQVRMWSQARCDTKRDCRQEGEENGDWCRARVTEFLLHLDPAALASVLAFALVVSVCALIVIRNLERGHTCKKEPKGCRCQIQELQSCIGKTSEESSISEAGNDFHTGFDLEKVHIFNKETTV